MTTENVAAAAGTAAAGGAGFMLGLPNPISAALYALIAAVIGWVTSWVLNTIKKRLGL